MNKKKLEQKKKEKEKRAKIKILARREELRCFKKEEQRKILLERSLEPKLPPLENKEKRNSEIKKQIERNLKILEALEQEYDKEVSARQEVHHNLESEGYLSIQDKMNALHDKALEQGYKEKELSS